MSFFGRLLLISNEIIVFRRQSYVGRIKFAQFDTVSTAKKLIVATEENVLAALNLKTGKLILLTVSK